MSSSKRESRLRRLIKKLFPSRTRKSSRKLKSDVHHEVKTRSGLQRSNDRTCDAPRPYTRKRRNTEEEKYIPCRQVPGNPHTAINLPHGWQPLITRVGDSPVEYHESNQEIQSPQYITHASPQRSHQLPATPKISSPPTVFHRIEPPPPLPPQAFMPVPGWDSDWDKPLGLRTGPDKGIWRTPSFRIQIRNQGSIRRMEAEARTGRRLNEAEALKMRSMKSIEEMAEDERMAGDEFLGIAAQVETASRKPPVIYQNFNVGGRSLRRYY